MRNILHILTKPTLPTTISGSDAVVLIQDGVYLKNLPEVPVYAVSDDMLSRGVTNDNIKSIDYDKWVELTATYKKSITW